MNAFWDGTKMTYGDGDGTNYGPLVSIDVAGHEMSHGVTENTAGLAYSGESGGLNEATSDIFGTMVEFYAANPKDPGDYLIGEQFDLKKHLGLRRMDNPASDGSSLNCCSASAGTADVHYSSGIGNHFYYLLAEGSGAKTINGVAHNSPTCNGSTRHRHRPDRCGEDLVPRTDRLHDLQHQLRGSTYGDAQRGSRPLRRGQHPIQHGGQRMERGCRVLISVPPRRSGSPGRGARAGHAGSPSPFFHHPHRLGSSGAHLGCPGRASHPNQRRQRARR